jgi:hypothetical protein
MSAFAAGFCLLHKLKQNRFKCGDPFGVAIEGDLNRLKQNRSMMATAFSGCLRFFERGLPL